MKNFKIKTGILTVGLLLSTISCERYLDINDNPNQPAIEWVTPNELLPVGITKCYSAQGRSLMAFSSVVMNTLAGNSLSFGAPYIDDYKPNVSNTFYTGIWDGLFLGAANFEQIIKYNDPEGKYVQYKAIAKIMKANYIQILTDLYGDMPYSEAFQQQNNLTPKYDKGENIYKASITDIEDAIALIDTHAGDKPGAADIVFKGEMEKWKAFANTLKLRYLLRMSNIPSGDLATFRDQKLAALSGATFINENVVENPGYSAANDSQQNPFTNYFVLTTAMSRPQNYSYNVASENVQIVMNGNSEGDARPVYQKFTGIVDGRRARMFNLVGGKVVGIRQGNLPGEAGVPTGGTLSRFNYGITIGGTSTPTSNPELLAMVSSRGGYIMSVAESKFLQAEAALRYPALFSNAQGNFTAAITASFTLFGSTANLPAYLTAISTKNGLGWAGTDANKMEAIMTQKWIALTGVNPEQSYFDYTKTGYPVTLSATIASNPKPNRLIYPLSEYIANAVNVPAISNTDVFSKNQYTPFWARN
ncbi:Starch-binding associating with outer membrane [Chryseobacterium oleae]|uniref:Starch-binding associating with outer membrane n=1 Tax=Chryseobacterium oleae TaxID=491207 RepID=A0A1I5CXT4_CHROL|nr:SusD/RagB family nutrient-binding outer membrane lipoprotein [Chryseobacterium oleae]SFN91676.1 Starch-binding associating with outer membrane [Chryseobacterium oleae]